MQNVIWIVCLLAVFALYMCRPKWGAMALLVAAMLVPFGGFSLTNATTLLRVELVLMPLLLGCQLLGIPGSGYRYQLSPVTLLFGLWVCWIGIASLLGDARINYAGLYGYARPVAVLVVFANIAWTARDVERMQFLFVLTAIPIGLLCLGQFLGFGVARTLSERAYSPATAAVLELQTENEFLGYTYRAVGVFGNVSPAATYFLIAMTLAVLLHGAGPTSSLWRRLLLFIGLLASMAGGLATLSGTFVAGFAPTILVMLGFSPPKRRRKILQHTLLLLAIALPGLAWARSISYTIDTQLAYQWSRLTSGDGFVSRYSSRHGVLAEAYERFWEHPLRGHGVTQQSAFVGDSFFVNLLYTGGVLGTVLFIIPVVLLCLVSPRLGTCGHMALAWTVVMMACGIGCSGVLAGRLGDWWWASQGVVLSLAACQLRTRPAGPVRTASPALGIVPQFTSGRGVGGPHSACHAQGSYRGFDARSMEAFSTSKHNYAVTCRPNQCHRADFAKRPARG